MRTSVAYSCILHAAVFAVAYYGLPELRRNIEMVDTPITVDIVTVADETNVPSPLPEAKAEPAPKAEPKPEPPPPPPEPEPKPTPPPPEPTPQAVAPPPPPEPKPEPKTKPKPEPKPEVKPEPPKPTPPAALAKITPRHKPKPPDAFASVLKTVAELKKQPPPQKAEEKPEKKPEPQESFETQIANALRAPARPFNPQRPMTISEIDQVRRQIARCWSLPAGAKDAQDLVIEIQTQMNPTGTVREAHIVNQARMRDDPFFRAAAESALRAVLNPRCSPLRLPPEKYDQWKDMVLNFNPREMF